MRRFREPMVFLKFETSCVFASSPIARCLGPKETSELGNAVKKSERTIGFGARDGKHTG